MKKFDAILEGIKDTGNYIDFPNNSFNISEPVMRKYKEYYKSLEESIEIKNQQTLINKFSGALCLLVDNARDNIMVYTFPVKNEPFLITY